MLSPKAELTKQEEKPQIEPAQELQQDDAWTVIRSYFSQHGLVSQQISSFERFMSFNIQDIIREIGTIQIDVVNQYLSTKKWQNSDNN